MGQTIQAAINAGGAGVLSEAALPTPASTYIIADYGRQFMEDTWIDNLRAANYTRVIGATAPHHGYQADAGGAQANPGTQIQSSAFANACD
jgi:hypothetical protein